MDYGLWIMDYGLWIMVNGGGAREAMLVRVIYSIEFKSKIVSK